MPSLKAKLQIQKLVETRDALKLELEAIRNKIAGVDLALSVMADDDDADPTESRPRARRGNVKTTLLNLLSEVGRSGLNAHTTVEMATRKGIELDRGTVSSLLSRLKADGVVDYDGERYRLREPRHVAERPDSAVAH